MKKSIITKKRLQHWIPFGLVLLFIIGWTILLHLYSPEELVDWLGVRNSYLVAFLVSVIGALSSFTTFSTYPAIVTLASGSDIQPVLLGICAGIGLTIGDILFYYLGFTARGVASEKMKDKLEKILKWVAKKGQVYISIFIFIYIGMTPFPNNLLTGSLAVIGYPLKKVIVPLTLGDIFLPLLAAWLAYQGITDFLW
ncbi:MAG: hypothetical protein R3345_14895 [Fulvivirga sp.]|nr:hypothetical protein [Fulvivirga sp.]